MTEKNNENETKFTVHANELEYIREKLDKINRKALKIGCTPMVLTVLREYEEIEVNDKGKEVKYNKADIELTGEPPKIAGWTFIATVEPVETVDGDDKNLINKMPGVTVEVPVEYRTASMFQCDHCHTKRYRNEIFVIQNEAGEFKVVGRQCIKDFMGYHANPKALVRMAEVWANFIAEVRSGLGGRDGEPVADLKEFLFRAAYFVNTFGYHKAMVEDEFGAPISPTKWATWGTFNLSQAYDHKDKYYGFFLLSDGTKPNNFGKSDHRTVMSDAEHHAAKVLSEAATAHMTSVLDVDDDQLNDYLYNMKTVLSMRYITSRYTGYAASIYAVYKRYIGEEEIRKERAKSQFVGTPGEKIEFIAKLIDVKHFENRFSGAPGRILIFGDASGNQYKWFTTADNGYTAIGDKVVVKATVKKHDEYKGLKSTVITRAKITPSN